jgi:hypothetical protein
MHKVQLQNLANFHTVHPHNQLQKPTNGYAVAHIFQKILCNCVCAVKLKNNMARVDVFDDIH